MMIRKQIYLGQRQQAVLKRLAKARGLSEAEIVRQAIDRQADTSRAASAPPDPAAWERARRFMLEMRARGPLARRPRTWKREDAYRERLSRHARRSG